MTLPGPRCAPLIHHKHLLQPGELPSPEGLQPVPLEVKSFCYKSPFLVTSVELTVPDSSCSWFLPWERDLFQNPEQKYSAAAFQKATDEGEVILTTLKYFQTFKMNYFLHTCGVEEQQEATPAPLCSTCSTDHSPPSSSSV